MTNRPEPRLVKRLGVFASASAVFSMLVGLSGLAGWTLHVPILDNWGAAPVTMKANSAACFVLIGISLWLLRNKENQPFIGARGLAAKTCATLAGLVGLLSLAEHFFRRDFGIDQFLLAAPPAVETASVRAGLMSPITAAAFLLLGLALLAIDWRTLWGGRPAQVLSLSAGAAATFGILSFAFDPHIYAAHLSLALPSAVTLAVFSLGLVCARTEWGLGSLLCSRSLGGSLARRLLPIALIPMLVGWVRWQITATGLYSEWSIVVLASLLTMSLLAGIIAWAAVAVDRNDVERRKVEEALDVSEEQLNRLLDRLEEPQNEVLLRRKVVGGFIAAVVLTCFLGLLSWQNSRRAEEDADWVTHTQVVLKTLDTTVSHLVDVETGGRGFALSGHEPFLEPYEAGRRALGADLEALRHLTADNAGQQSRLEILGPQVNAKIEFSDGLVAGRQHKGAVPNRSQLLQGTRLTNAARATIQQMDEEEERLLGERVQRTHAARRLTISVMLMGSLLAMAFLIVAGFAISSQISISAQARAQVEALNASLEQRVERRTAALQSEIIERKQVEGALNEQAKVLDLAQVMVRDTTSHILLWNLSAEKLYGYTREEAVGRVSHELLQTQFPEPLEQIEGKLDHAGTWGGELVHRKQDGSVVVVSSVWVLHRDAQGRPLRILESNTDITERKQVEEALRESEEGFRLLIDGVRDYAICMLDPAGRVIGWNSGAARIKGYRSDEILGKHFSVFYQAEDIEAEIPARELEESLSKGRFEGKGWRVRKDGSAFWANVVIVPMHDQHGTHLGFSKIARDITERKQVEEALHESQERFHAMANGIQQLAWMADADGSIFWYNQRWYEYTGTTLEQNKGWTWESVHDPSVLPKVIEGWKKAIATSKPFDMEFPLRGADGKFRMFLTRVMPVKDAKGRVVRWFGTNTDISELKEAEELLAGQARELAQSREALEAQTVMFKQVLASMGEGLIAADREGRFLLWNDAAKKLMGRGAENLPTEQWTPHYSVFMPDGITPYPADRLPLVRALHGEPAHVELIVRQPDTEQGRMMEVTARPMNDARGNLCGGVAILRDITQRKADEREIQKLNDELELRVVERTAQLETANKELESFSYSVSHDLRAPLRHVSGFCNLLATEFGATIDPAGQHYLERIQSGTQKMGVLVDELLNLARVGRHALNRHTTKLNPIVAEVLAILQPDSEGRQVEWIIADLPAVECDPVLVKQIFQNLLANALKFTGPRGGPGGKAQPGTPGATVRTVIEVSHKEEDGQAVFMVRDNGIGFNMKYVDKLFGVFQRLHSADEFEGTGIGLVTVQRIVHKHGGRAWAEGELGKGATFYFTLGAGKQTESKASGAAAGCGS